MEILNKNYLIRKHTIIMNLVTFIISFIGATIYSLYVTFGALLYIGCVTLIINLLFSLVYTLLNRKEIGYTHSGKHLLLLTVAVLSLIIPFTVYYLFSIFLLDGFRLTLLPK